MIPTCGWNTKRTFDCALYAFIQLHNKNSSLPPSVFSASSVVYVCTEGRCDYKRSISKPACNHFKRGISFAIIQCGACMVNNGQEDDNNAHANSH